MTGTTLNQWILAFQCGQRNKVLSWHYFICCIFWQVYIHSQTEECIHATFLDKKKFHLVLLKVLCVKTYNKGVPFIISCAEWIEIGFYFFAVLKKNRSTI